MLTDFSLETPDQFIFSELVEHFQKNAEIPKRELEKILTILETWPDDDRCFHMLRVSEFIRLDKNSPLLQLCRMFSFRNIRPNQDNFEDLFHSPNLSNVRILAFDSHNLRDKGSLLSSSPFLKNLRKLHLTATRLNTEDLGAIFQSNQLPSLEFINVGCNKVDKTTITNITHSNLSRQIKVLGLGLCGLVGEHIELLFDSSSLVQLETLDLGSNRFGNHGLAAFLKAHSPKALKTLFLHRNQLDDEGASMLAKSEKLRSLEELYIDGNELTVSGLKTILTSPRLQKLRFVNIDFNPKSEFNSDKKESDMIQAKAFGQFLSGYAGQVKIRFSAPGFDRLVWGG